MLHTYLKSLIRRGRLSVTIGRGTVWTFGTLKADDPGHDIAFRLKGPWTAFKLGANPYLYFGEAYMNGDLVMEKGTLWQLMELIGVNLESLPSRPDSSWKKFRRWFGRLMPAYSVHASRHNVAHHYDLSERLYRLFLDGDMQYSCAYFAEPGMTLEAAQVAKKNHIAAKLLLKPGQKVLDIGCGWGGMALHLARTAGADVTGVTLSEEQLAVAQMRGRAPDVEQNVHFELKDYREVEGHFDRIVSVGMFEHVGRAGFEGYFRTVRDRLSEDGVALIHTIGRHNAGGGRNAWLEKYIFPGGYIPSLSEIVIAAESAGLWINDVEPLRLHYAETLRCWRERFLANRAQIADMYDERFCRMWEFYLCFCELGFRYGDLLVYQIQLGKTRQATPITRDYMTDAERARAQAQKPSRRSNVSPIRLEAGE